MLHTIRQIVDDDVRWRGILRGLNATFWHQTVQGSDIEHYISRGAGVDLGKVFDQYLRDVRVPVLEYRTGRDSVSYRWAEVVPGFDMPVKVTVGGAPQLLHPTEQWQTLAAPGGSGSSFTVDRNFYVIARAGTP